MTTGSHRHQTYWMQNPNGTLIQFPWVYHIDTKRWVFRIDSFLRPPRDKVTYNIWNLHCIGCHATGGQPRVDPNMHTMHSTGELGISCEACHGPGREHAAFHRKDVEDANGSGSKMVDPRERRPEVSAQICGQCHIISERVDEEYWMQHGDSYRAGGDNFGEINRVVQYSEDIPFRDQFGERLATRFWPDGTVRTGGREYNGLIKSACYLDGEGERKMTCLSCHSMHDYVSPSKLIARKHTGNQACTQCHTEPQYGSNLEEHTHHQSESSGSLCVNCHMARTSYALFSATRSHRIQSPKIALSQLGERPNACNLCHLDQTKSWTAEHLSDWYELESHPMPENEKQLAASVVWALQGDAAQRTVTAWHMGWDKSRDVSNDRWMVPILAELLDDPYAAVRYISYESLKKHDGFENLQYDFDGPAEKRRKIRQQVLQEWQRGRDPRSSSGPGGRVLLTPGGDWDDNLARKLIEKRDDRPITLLE